MQERLAKLSGGSSCYKSWCCNRSWNERKKIKNEDALNATRAAVEEGIIVAGGGAILVEIMEEMKDFNETGEIAMGIEIVKKPLQLQSNKLLKTLD